MPKMWRRDGRREGFRCLPQLCFLNGKARTGKYRSLPKEFFDIASARWALGEEKLAKADAAEALKTLPLARHLYRTYLTSVIGAGLTLLGVIIGGFGI